MVKVNAILGLWSIPRIADYFFDSEESLDSTVAVCPLAAADLLHSEALCPGFLQ